MPPISPFKEIRRLQEQLKIAEARVTGLESQLRAMDVKPIEIAEWMVPLRPQGVAVVMALSTAYPNLLDAPTLNRIVPRGHHSLDRHHAIIQAIIHHIRTEIGKDAILTVWGRGFRLSDEFAAVVKGQSR